METQDGRNLFLQGLNDEILQATRKAVEKLLEKGLSEEEALQKIEEVVPEAIGAAVEPIVSDLKRRGPGMVLEHHAIRQGFEARLLQRWLKPLTMYEMVLVGIQEAGSDFNELHRPTAARDVDLLFEALTLLHARACLTGSEIHSLLRSGHPFGAHARWRTLHELAVVAYLLGKNGRDLAERYLLHQTIQETKDAEDYQRHGEALGYEALPDEEMAHLRAERQQLIERFGKPFKNQYGWASELFDQNENPNFRELEKLAGMEHMRPHYGWASHRVHAGAKGAALNVLHRGPYSAMLAGPTNWGLADPGHGALIRCTR